MKMKKLEFNQFIAYANSADSLGYVVYGHDFIFKFFLDLVKASENFEIIDLSVNLPEQLKRLRYKSLLATKKLAYYSGKMDKEIVDLFNQYIDRASPYVMLVIHYDEKPRLLKSFAKGLRIIDMKYPGYKWVSEYVKYLGFKYNTEWQKGALKFFLSRVGREYQKINNYLLRLVEGGNLITRDDVLDVVDDDSLSSMSAFYATLVINVQKKKPYQVYQDFVDGGVKPQSIWYGFRKYMDMLYQAKLLRMYGVLMHGSIIEMRLPAVSKLPFELGDDSILQQPAYYIEQMLEVADKVTLRRILLVQLYIKRSFRTTKKGKQYIEDDDVYLSLINLYNNELSSIDPQYE
jgi:hypothetical protein